MSCSTSSGQASSETFSTVDLEVDRCFRCQLLSKQRRKTFDSNPTTLAENNRWELKHQESAELVNANKQDKVYSTKSLSGNGG